MSISRHVPQRSCIGCRKVTAKGELVRIVATPEGVMVDETGRKNGRGAYICRSMECWEAALKKDRLRRALRTGISVEDKNRVCQYVEKLKEGI